MLHQSLTWRFQVAPRAAWIARTQTGYFEIRLDTNEFGFCVDDQPGYPVLWFPVRSISDAKSRCEALARDADDHESGITVAVFPDRGRPGMCSPAPARADALKSSVVAAASRSLR